MQKFGTVVVHGVHLYLGHVESPEVAGFKATLEAIKALGGDPIEGTAQTVLLSDLDRQGHYRRVATGWGELD